MQQEVMHQADWPTYLSPEQREQLLASKIARAVAASKLAAPKNVAHYVANQSLNKPFDNRGLKQSYNID